MCDSSNAAYNKYCMCSGKGLRGEARSPNSTAGAKGLLQGSKLSPESILEVGGIPAHCVEGNRALGSSWS